MGEQPVVRYERDGAVGTVILDDGKANALSPTTQALLGAAFAQAAEDGVVLVVAGRPGLFSAGFDLKIIREGGAATAAMVLGGFRLAEQVLTHPFPVVMACTGHAVAMGCFLLACGDYCIGPVGDFKLQANEVAIGLTVPRPAIEILSQRLTPAALTRTVALSEVWSPASALGAGLLDELVPPDEVLDRARTFAAGLAALDLRAHGATKARLRRPVLARLREAIAEDEAAGASLAP